MGDSDMEIRQLKYFIEIVNSKSFSKAATTLYTTQPALTKSIKLLEDELGFKLIDRSTSYFKLTDKGALFYQHARDVYNRFQDLLLLCLWYGKYRYYGRRQYFFPGSDTAFCS